MKKFCPPYVVISYGYSRCDDHGISIADHMMKLDNPAGASPVPAHFSSRRTFLKAATLLSTATLYPLISSAKPSGTSPAKPEGFEKLILGMVVFDGFQLLDVFGPLDIFGFLQDKVSIVIISESGKPVKSSAGPSVNADHSFADAPKLDILMIPGGMGTRREVENDIFLQAFKNLATVTPTVASICTGSAVLAKTGLLDGHQATTNKRAYAWATSQSNKVEWIAEARWVEDGKYYSSSGVSAGIDMALGLVANMFGKDEAIRIANIAEYVWNDKPKDDPFAKINGLVK